MVERALTCRGLLSNQATGSRTHGWVTLRNLWLSEDDAERKVQTSEALIEVARIQLLAARLERGT